MHNLDKAISFLFDGKLNLLKNYLTTLIHFFVLDGNERSLKAIYVKKIFCKKLNLTLNIFNSLQIPGTFNVYKN